jgi:hypothetical protein
MSEAEGDVCVGREGTGHCRFAPVVTIAGDSACSYHVVSVLRLRLGETRKAVRVERINDGPWGSGREQSHTT